MPRDDVADKIDTDVVSQLTTADHDELAAAAACEATLQVRQAKYLRQRTERLLHNIYVSRGIDPKRLPELSKSESDSDSDSDSSRSSKLIQELVDEDYDDQVRAALQRHERRMHAREQSTNTRLPCGTLACTT